jgi:hypothetical protein
MVDECVCDTVHEVARLRSENALSNTLDIQQNPRFRTCHAKPPRICQAYNQSMLERQQFPTEPKAPGLLPTRVSTSHQQWQARQTPPGRRHRHHRRFWASRRTFDSVSTAILGWHHGLADPTRSTYAPGTSNYATGKVLTSASYQTRIASTACSFLVAPSTPKRLLFFAPPTTSSCTIWAGRKPRSLYLVPPLTYPTHFDSVVTAITLQS